SCTSSGWAPPRVMPACSPGRQKPGMSSSGTPIRRRHAAFASASASSPRPNVYSNSSRRIASVISIAISSVPGGPPRYAEPACHDGVSVALSVGPGGGPPPSRGPGGRRELLGADHEGGLPAGGRVQVAGPGVGDEPVPGVTVGVARVDAVLAQPAGNVGLVDE